MAIDLTLNNPGNKRDLTKDNMLAYVKKKGTPEDKAWFKELMLSNKTKKYSSLKKEEIDGYNMKPIREAFAVRFFYDISDKAKREAKKSKKPTRTFEDELNDL